jgi:hypothetical protein
MSTYQLSKPPFALAGGWKAASFAKSSDLFSLLISALKRLAGIIALVVGAAGAGISDV